MNKENKRILRAYRDTWKIFYRVGITGDDLPEIVVNLIDTLNSTKVQLEQERSRHTEQKAALTLLLEREERSSKSWRDNHRALKQVHEQVEAVLKTAGYCMGPLLTLVTTVIGDKLEAESRAAQYQEQHTYQLKECQTLRAQKATLKKEVEHERKNRRTAEGLLDNLAKVLEAGDHGTTLSAFVLENIIREKLSAELLVAQYEEQDTLLINENKDLRATKERLTNELSTVRGGYTDLNQRNADWEQKHNALKDENAALKKQLYTAARLVRDILPTQRAIAANAEQAVRHAQKAMRILDAPQEESPTTVGEMPSKGRTR